MIQEFVKAWDANKNALREYIRTHEQKEYDMYVELVKILFEVVINPYFKDDFCNPSYNIEAIHVIDDGDYQGSQLFIIPSNDYQPSPYKYVWTYCSYGSCSGCDTLLAISGYDNGLPSEEQINGYMILLLHLLQRCKYLIGYDEWRNED